GSPLRRRSCRKQRYGRSTRSASETGDSTTYRSASWSADSLPEEVSDRVGEQQSRCAADDNPHDGKPDAAAAEPRAEGAGEGEGDEHRRDSDGDAPGLARYQDGEQRQHRP